jgi:hypothetical protein
MVNEGSLSQRRLLRNSRKAFRKASAKDPDFIRASGSKEVVDSVKRSIKARDTKMDRKRLFHQKSPTVISKDTRLNRLFGRKSHTDSGKSEIRHKETPKDKFTRQEMLKSKLKKVNEGSMSVLRLKRKAKFAANKIGDKVGKDSNKELSKYKSIKAKQKYKKVDSMKRLTGIKEEKAQIWKSGILLSDPKKGRGKAFIASKVNQFKDKHRHGRAGKGRYRLDTNLVGKPKVKAQLDFKRADSKKRLMRSNSLSKSVEIADQQRFKRGRKTKLARKLFAGESERRKAK